MVVYDLKEVFIKKKLLAVEDTAYRYSLRIAAGISLFKFVVLIYALSNYFSSPVMFSLCLVCIVNITGVSFGALYFITHSISTKYLIKLYSK
jgi:hypothetical protein